MSLKGSANRSKAYLLCLIADCMHSEYIFGKQIRTERIVEQ